MDEEKAPQTLTVPIEDTLRVFHLLEQLNEFLHQPSKYTPDGIERFSEENYEDVRQLYYEVVWGWLPPSIQERVEAGDNMHDIVRQLGAPNSVVDPK